MAAFPFAVILLRWKAAPDAPNEPVHEKRVKESEREHGYRVRPPRGPAAAVRPRAESVHPHGNAPGAGAATRWWAAPRASCGCWPADHDVRRAARMRMLAPGRPSPAVSTAVRPAGRWPWGSPGRAACSSWGDHRGIRGRLHTGRPSAYRPESQAALLLAKAGSP